MRIKVIPNTLWLARTPILPGLSTRCGQSLSVPEAPCLGMAWLLTGINKINRYDLKMLFSPPQPHHHRFSPLYFSQNTWSERCKYMRHGKCSGLFNKWQLGTAWQECNISQEWCEKSAYAHSWCLWNISTPQYERDVWQKTDRGMEMEEWEEIRLLALSRGRWNRQLQHGTSSGCFLASLWCLTVCCFCPEGVCGFTPFVIVALVFCLPPKCTSSTGGRKRFSGTLNWGLTRSFPNKARSHSQSLQLTVFVAAS